MRSGLVVVKSPRGNGKTRLLQGLKPVFIQALIPEGAVKALDVSVLRRAAKLNQNVLDAVLLCPSHEYSASELWSVVSPDRLGATPKCGCSVQQTGDIVATNAKVRCDVHALTREVVSDCQALDTPGDGARPTNGIAHKVHAPRLVDGQSGHQWYTHANALGLLAFPDRQTLSGVDAVHTFVIDIGKLRTQNVVDHAVAPASARMGGLGDLVTQLHIERAGLALMAIGIPA